MRKFTDKENKWIKEFVELKEKGLSHVQELQVAKILRTKFSFFALKWTYGEKPQISLYNRMEDKDKAEKQYYDICDFIYFIKELESLGFIAIQKFYSEKEDVGYNVLYDRDKYIYDEKNDKFRPTECTDLSSFISGDSSGNEFPMENMGNGVYGLFQIGQTQNINLDFAYLQEMSTVDMHFRFLINRMCLDIEQALKVKLVKDLSNDANAYKGRYEHIIQGYDDCPIWVLCEVLTFGEFLRLYDFYYGNTAVVSGAILGLVRCLRNGSAHNNCLLANLSHGTSKPSREIKDYVKKMESITTSQRQKKLSCRPMLEFVALIYTYELVVTQK